MITSTSNPQVKNLVQLKKKARARREQGVYVVEGVRMFREAPAGEIAGIYVSESFLAQPESKELLLGMDFEVLSDTVFDYVSDTKTPQGILCLMRMPSYDPKDMAQAGDGMWLVLESLQDPGNLGTLFRTGEAAGVSGIIMDTGTADVYSPKTIRSTMGSIYRVPFFVTDDLPGTLAAMKDGGIRIFAAGTDGSVRYTEADYTKATAFLIGNEGNGLSGEALAAADAAVCIPMRGQVESLNASMAAGILLYEADRQRREKEI